jgi:hypothetical protein
MQHQINVDESGNPIYINLEFSSGNLLIKDHDRNLIKKTIGNPAINSRGDNLPFESMDQAYTWFLTTSLSRRIDEEIGEE